MNLQESIRRILREETEFSLKFKRRIGYFTEFIWNNFVTQHPCDFENFTAFMQGIHNEIREAVYYSNDGDENADNWLMYDEGSKYVEKYMIEDLKEFYYSRCVDYDTIGESILNEGTNIPLQIRRRISSRGNLFDLMRKGSLRYIGKGISLDTIIDHAAIFIAQEVLPWHDEQGNDYPPEEYSEWFESLRKFLIDEYGEETKEYLEENELEGSFDNDGYKYVFWKHSEPSGGNGFSEGYDTWGKLLQARGWWFPLDWKKIKSELDKMDEGKKLILRPNDKHNTMGYYFSIIKKK